MKKEAILQKTISQLDLSERRRNAMVRDLINMAFNFNGGNPIFNGSAKEIREWSEKLMVEDIINTYNYPMDLKRDHLWLKEFYGLAIKLGLTKLDWLALPYETARSEFHQYSKEELKSKSALILEPPPKILEVIRDRLDLRRDMLIVDLLEVSCKSFGQRYNFDRSAYKLCQRLMEMGFGYEDGIFIQEDTRRKFVEDLMVEESLDKETAQQFADLVYKRGYIARPYKWNLIR